MNQPLFNRDQQDSFRALSIANPQLARGLALPSPLEGGVLTPCTADRVLLAMGTYVGSQAAVDFAKEKKSA